MGLNCRIFKDREGSITGVVAPNGKESKLFDEAFKITGSKEKAVEVWATAYTPGFVRYYGNWTNRATRSAFSLDENGEPRIDDVLAYFRKNTYMIGEMTRKDLLDAREFMRNTGSKNFTEVASSVRSSMIVNGIVTVNEGTLKRSGLYTDEEISDILSTSGAAEELADKFDTLLSTEAEVSDPESSFYMERNGNYTSVIPGDIYTGRKTSFYKNETEDLDELDMAIRERAAGIENRAEFDNAILSLSDRYPNFVNRYRENTDVAFRIYMEYSGVSRVERVVVAPGGVRRVSQFTLPKLVMFSRGNDRMLPSIRGRISRLLSFDNFRSSDARSELKRIERDALFFGMDLIGLRQAYESGKVSDEAMQELLMTLDLYLSDMSRGGNSYTGDMAATIRRVFGSDSSDVVRRLPPGLESRDVVYLEQDVPAKEAFEKYGLLKVGDHLYMVSTNRESLEDLYDSVPEIIKLRPGKTPSSAFPKGVFENGSINYGRLHEANTEEVRELLRNYVRSVSDSENTERMILTRIAFGLDPVVETRTQDTIEDAMNRYMNRRRVSSEEKRSIVDRLYNIYLREKEQNSEMYRRALKYFKFTPDGNILIDTNNTDVLTDMGIALTGEARSLFGEYTDMTMDPISYAIWGRRGLENRFVGDDVMYEFYKSHPEELREVKRANVRQDEDGGFFVEGMYDRFAKINGEVMMKITEGNTGSVYKLFEGTASETLYESTQVSKESPSRMSTTHENLINDALPVKGEEIDRLSNKLECR